jgi:nucleoside-diphosphate-sugar epimerase
MLGGHELHAPGRTELDLFDPDAVAAAVAGSDAVMHLATRIPGRDAGADPAAWRENDRLRIDAARILVDAALARGVPTFVQPTVTFVYPDGIAADEDTRIDEVEPHLRSALAAEREARRFAAADGRRGVVLRLGLLDGPGTGRREPDGRFGATLHVADAAEALLKALHAPSGTYNACRDGERVSNRRLRGLTGWRPRREGPVLAMASARAIRDARISA